MEFLKKIKKNIKVTGKKTRKHWFESMGKPVDGFGANVYDKIQEQICRLNQTVQKESGR